MTETKDLTCICCPMGCQIQVTLEDNTVTNVTGNTCKRGEDYARKEVTHPTRIVTSTVRVNGGDIAMVSVKTESDIPKECIMDIMNCINKAQIDAPVNIGDTIITNVANTGVDIIATKSVAKK